MTSRSEIAARLAGVDLFARCSKGDLRIIARHAEQITLAAGSEAVRQGDTGDAFFLLLSGKATVARDGLEVTELGPGDFFGELALLDPAPRAATVTVTAPADVVVLGARMFKVLLRELPALSAAMLASLARRARDAGSAWSKDP
jgi:CRP-like cAMP-binding protein